MTCHLFVAGLAMVAALAVALPSPVSAQDVRNYSGYCYVKRQDADHTGALIGAVAGGVIGNSVSGSDDRALGTIAGVLLGAAIGSTADDEETSVPCYRQRYFSYEGSYYDPPAPPPGYVVAYYQHRPRFTYTYRTYHYDRRPAHYYQTRHRRQVSYYHHTARVKHTGHVRQDRRVQHRREEHKHDKGHR